jgi:hypothetical protein
MAFKPAIEFLPEGLRSQELYPKICAMLDHIVQNFETELEDTKYKFRGPEIVREEVIKQIIVELGFDYIESVMETITGFEFKNLLDFLGLINLLKGSRSGLELVLKLLGFDSIITEWWETNPKLTPHTFNLTVIVNNSIVPDVNETINRVRIFTEHYVYPKLDIVDFRFSFPLAEKNVTFAGFIKQYASTNGGLIMARI